MIKIFIPEYIIFIEEIDFSIFFDIYFKFINPDHIIIFKDTTVNFSSHRTTIKGLESEAIYRTKEWVYSKFLVGRRMKFFGGHESIFVLKTLKKWFW